MTTPLPEAVMIEVPAIQREGIYAAVLGTNMSTLTTPLGFTFCPYGVSKPAERWNFLHGCIAAHFEEVSPEARAGV